MNTFSINPINRNAMLPRPMQQPSKKNRPPTPGPGRPKGYKTPATIRKLAVKLLQDILLDEAAPISLRLQAACKLLDEFKV